MPGWIFWAIFATIIVLSIGQQVRRYRSKSKLGIELESEGFISINPKELDPTLRPLLKVRRPKILAEGVLNERVCVIAYQEIHESDENLRIVVYCAIQSPVGWPRFSLTPMKTLTALSKHRIRADEPEIDKHWMITCSDNHVGQIVLDELREGLRIKPRVMRSFRLSSSNEQDAHTRCVMYEHWIVHSYQIGTYELEAALDYMKYLENFATRIERAVDSRMSESVSIDESTDHE